MSEHLITGGAGFIGSHLAGRLVAEGHKVTVVDDLSTGRAGNVIPSVRLHISDVCRDEWVEAELEESAGPDVVWHLASPCSPPDYQARPVATLMANGVGTINALRLAHQVGAKFVLASTSEVYGDPHVHPQPESYYGNVAPIGPRSCYDEGKRYAEALTAAYGRDGLDIHIARIFNTYGPLMRDDGRVVMRFLTAATRGEPLEIHGDGEQTRSFCHIDDTVDGLIRLADSSMTVCNIGSDDEVTIRELALLIIHRVTRSTSTLLHLEPDPHDPRIRRPDLSRLHSLGWRQTVGLERGLTRTLDWLRGLT